MFLVRSGALEGYESLVSRLGENPTQLLSASGIAPAQLRRPDSYISYPLMAELLELSAQKCSEPLFGLKLAEQQGSLTIGALGMSAAQQPTLAAAIEHIAKHLHIHADGIQLEMYEERQHAEAHVSIQFSTPRGIDQLMQLSCGLLHNNLSLLVGERSHNVTLMLAQTQPLNYQKQDGAHKLGNLQFNGPVNGARFPREWLDKPTVADSRLTRQHFQLHIENLERRYPKNLQDQVRHIIANLLPSNDCNLQQVAKALDIHERVLQKRLKSLGCSYASLLQETRHQTALELLRYKHLSMTEIALNLGYADLSIFSRNFKAWTGKSPSHFLKDDLAETT